jgi:hypothetical protein
MENKNLDTIKANNKKKIINEINNDFNCIERLHEENEKIREIVKKCLNFINLCQCFDKNFLTERKQINLLINNFNKHSNNSIINDGFELLVINNKFDNNKRSVSNKSKCCQTFHEINYNLLTHESSNQLKSNSEDIELKTCKKSSLKTGINTKKKTVKKSQKLKPSKLESKLGINLSQTKTNLRKNNVKNRKILRKKLRKNENELIESKVDFSCDWTNCGKVFKSKQNLKIHKDIHLEVKNYRCDWPGCDEAFLRKKQLDSHISGHTNDKRFK